MQNVWLGQHVCKEVIMNVYCCSKISRQWNLLQTWCCCLQEQAIFRRCKTFSTNFHSIVKLGSWMPQTSGTDTFVQACLCFWYTQIIYLSSHVGPHWMCVEYLKHAFSSNFFFYVCCDVCFCALPLMLS